MRTVFAFIACILVVHSKKSSCRVDGEKYEHGEVIDVKEECISWVARRTEYSTTQRYCRKGQVRTKTWEAQCAKNTECCQDGDFAYCADQCEIDDGSCNLYGKVYENGEVIFDTLRMSCINGEGGKKHRTTEDVCRDGEVREESYDGECYDYPDFVCCEYGRFVGCTNPPSCDPSPGRSCHFWDQSYPDGAVMDILGYSCQGWGAMQSEVNRDELICRDGTPTYEATSVRCDNSWACCQIGKSAYCAPHWQDCDNFYSDQDFSAGEVAANKDESAEIEAYRHHKKKNCRVNGKKYKHGEVIRDVSRECMGWGAAASTILTTQDVCRNGKVKEEINDSQCKKDYVCCGERDDIRCEKNECPSDNGKPCWMHGKSYNDGQIMSHLGYSCQGWGGAQSELREELLMCRNGVAKSESIDMPCGNNWACCQTGTSARCESDWTKCENNDNNAAAMMGRKKSGYIPPRLRTKRLPVRDLMEVFARAEFDGNVTGDILVDGNGNIALDLNISELDLSECDSAEDEVPLLLYHIVTDCEEGLIGEILDPFEADTDCDDLSEDTEADYFNCRLGDLSGRFGAILAGLDDTIEMENNLSYRPSSGKHDGICGLRLSPEAVSGTSIVFRCNDDYETPLFCGRFRMVFEEDG